MNSRPACVVSAVAGVLFVLLTPAPSWGLQSGQGPSASENTGNPESTTTLRARRGEGIWNLLRRAGRTPTSSGVQRFREINERNILPGGGLMVGRTYEVPGGGESASGGGGSTSSASEFSLHPIFGPAHERVERKSDRLEGHVYYIVSGHGGPDPGTLARYRGRSLPEDEVAYDVALRLARRLLEEGATPYLIVKDHDDGIRDDTWFRHDEDERYLNGARIALDQRRRLQDRVYLVNRLYEKHRSTARSQRLLSLHVDARGTRHEPQIDVHFLVASRNGSRFADVLRSTFRSRYAAVQPGRGYDGTVSYRNLYVLRHSRPVATMVELGNIRNPRDQMRLTSPRNRQAVAEWLLDGLLREAR